MYVFEHILRACSQIIFLDMTLLE